MFNSDEVCEMLTNLRLRDPASVQTFSAHRITKSGLDQIVTVKIYDRGPASGGGRFMCSATSDDGKGTSGNSADTVQAALAIVHWYKLD